MQAVREPFLRSSENTSYGRGLPRRLENDMPALDLDAEWLWNQCPIEHLNQQGWNRPTATLVTP
jgi:hypothetical protein